jgi:predicted DNA-binding transcriptional regulator AlpA
MSDKLQDHLAYPPRGMDADRAAAYLGIGRTKFLELVDAGRMPEPVRIEDELPRWDRLDLDAAWDDLKQRRNDPLARDRDKFWARQREREKERAVRERK